jgi:hypothetical protein
MFAPASAEGGPIWHPKLGTSWQIQFSEPLVSDPLDVQAYDLDGFETSATTVADLHEHGVHVLCYVSMGTWEDWRPDAGQYPAAVIGKEWTEWKGERFLDIRRLDLLAPVIEARLDMCKAKGFDAVEPDNIDTYQDGKAITGFDLTAADQIRFNLWLAKAAHERDLAIGQKNIPDLTTDLEPHFDFAVTEDCFADSWCDDVRPYLDHDKAVFAIEYTDTRVKLKAICPGAVADGYSVILKHRDLDAWSATCPGT